MGSLFGTIARGLVRSPITKLIPGVGTALTVAQVGLTAASVFGGGGSGASSGMPPLPGRGGMVPTSAAAGKRTVFGNDPNVTDDLKASVISKGNLKVFYRAPKGYVVMKDQVGDPMGVPKYLARRYGWKPAKKPLLSIRDTNSLKTAGRAIKKLQKAEKMARGIANWHTPHKAASKNIVVTGKVIGRKAA